MEHLESAKIEWFRCQLKVWASQHLRDFLWRRTTDPYAVFVAEFLLHSYQRFNSRSRLQVFPCSISHPKGSSGSASRRRCLHECNLWVFTSERNVCANQCRLLSNNMKAKSPVRKFNYLLCMEWASTQRVPSAPMLSGSP